MAWTSRILLLPVKTKQGEKQIKIGIRKKRVQQAEAEVNTVPGPQALNYLNKKHCIISQV